MIVVSDTPPLRYLIEIEAIEVLPSLFGQVVIPVAVSEELQHPKSPPKIKSWIQSPPNWLEIRPADVSLFVAVIPLDRGETEAISLAIELNADAILMDERAGRSEAARVGLLVFPTLTILETAGSRGLLDLPEVIERLAKTSFRVSPKLLLEIIGRFRPIQD
jgi:predicted nucleic acid-binding protein